MARQYADGTERIIDGRLRVHYDGYWIKAYPLPSDTLSEKRHLIEVLTRRLFDHVEHGVYVPGARLDEARHTFDAETDPARKRVKGGMLAGALFNRATDILTKLVELQSHGVEILANDPLMLLCGEQLQEALTLGQAVLHRSGDEGIDELWGEPFKAFAFSMQDFYRSRYLKVAAAMGCVDRIAKEMAPALEASTAFHGIAPLVADLAAAAKAYSETMRTDSDIFDVWAAFAVGVEKLLAVRPEVIDSGTLTEHEVDLGLRLIRDGADLVSSIARARVPMAKSTADLIDRLRRYREACSHGAPNSAVSRSTRATPVSKSSARLKPVSGRNAGRA